MRHRLPALDWMRGIVMVLMATDHASEAFNAARPVTDSALFPQSELDPMQFAHRWISHLCAPTFLFLAGTSLALSIGSKIERGASAWSIDRDLLVRGAIILGVDLFFINWFWEPGILVLQVMTAIGLSMMGMVLLRRLPTAILMGVSLLTLAVAEFFLGSSLGIPFEFLPVLNAFTFGAGYIDTPIENVALFASIGLLDKIVMAYPFVPWLAMMALGWGLGRFLLATRSDTPPRWSPRKLMAVTGVASLALFCVVRGFNGFGNMRLLRLDGSWVEWLHVSKYPPSISFTALELGLMALILAWLFGLQERVGAHFSPRNPILVFGQTAFFFYIAHIFLFEVSARALGMYGEASLAESTIAVVVSLIVLYPACVAYRSYKVSHPRSLLRYL